MSETQIRERDGRFYAIVTVEKEIVLTDEQRRWLRLSGELRGGGIVPAAKAAAERLEALEYEESEPEHGLREHLYGTSWGRGWSDETVSRVKGDK
jgi:hypothetical protein